MDQSIYALAKYGYYKKSVWVTLLSNVTAVAVAFGMFILATLAMGMDLFTGKVGFMVRFAWAGWLLIMSYLAYMAPGFLVALPARKSENKRTQ